MVVGLLVSEPFVNGNQLKLTLRLHLSFSFLFIPQTDLDNVPLKVQGDHIPNLGRMVEDMEIKLRNLLSEVYFVSFLASFSLLLSLPPSPSSSRHVVLNES